MTSSAALNFNFITATPHSTPKNVAQGKEAFHNLTTHSPSRLSRDDKQDCLETGKQRRVHHEQQVKEQIDALVFTPSFESLRPSSLGKRSFFHHKTTSTTASTRPLLILQNSEQWPYCPIKRAKANCNARRVASAGPNSSDTSPADYSGDIHSNRSSLFLWALSMSYESDDDSVISCDSNNDGIRRLVNTKVKRRRFNNNWDDIEIKFSRAA